MADNLLRAGCLLVVVDRHPEPAASGALALTREDRFRPGQKVLFWHGGETPAVFAFAEALSPRTAR